MISKSIFKTLTFLHIRNLFIRTSKTPNPLCLKFLPGKPVLKPEYNLQFKEYSNIKHANDSLLARQLLSIDGINKILFGNDFISITRKEETEWEVLKPEILSAITEFYLRGSEIITIQKKTEKDMKKGSKLTQNEQEILDMIIDLLKIRVRPMLNDDGGDLQLRGIDFKKGVFFNEIIFA